MSTEFDAIQQDAWVLSFLKRLPSKRRRQIAKKWKLESLIRHENARAAFRELIETRKRP